MPSRCHYGGVTSDETTGPKVTTFRLDPDIREQVDAVATAERRSLNSTVNVLLAEALRARDAACSPNPERTHLR